MEDLTHTNYARWNAVLTAACVISDTDWLLTGAETNMLTDDLQQTKMVEAVRENIRKSVPENFMVELTVRLLPHKGSDILHEIAHIFLDKSESVLSRF